jgi:hypothetical protein
MESAGHHVAGEPYGGDEDNDDTAKIAVVKTLRQTTKLELLPRKKNLLIPEIPLVQAITRSKMPEKNWQPLIRPNFQRKHPTRNLPIPRMSC